MTRPSCRQLSCSSTRLQHGAQQQMRAGPCLQPLDMAEHRLVYFAYLFSSRFHSFYQL